MTTAATPGASVRHVRVVVVDYDGGDHTLECLRSITATDWPADALDVVLVDNASTLPVVDVVQRELPSVRVVRAAVNRGFGAGANLGIGDLDDVDGVDHVAIVNNDVVVPPGWLRPLVDALEADAGLGAASPKILMRDQYREVMIEAPTHTSPLDPRPRGVCVTGLSIDGRDAWSRARTRAGFWGPEYRRGAPVAQWTGNGPMASLLVPARGSAALVLSADREVSVAVSVGDTTTMVQVGTLPTSHPIPDGGPALDVIHNVGTELTDDGYAGDRGYLETDKGQYDEPADVFAWCGAAVLLPARYLRQVGRFDEQLFLYYEDVDLAWRGRSAGWRYRTVPSSVVRHVHSASTSANAARTAQLNERNRLAILARHADRAEVARMLWRYALVTGSYARRDLVAPLLRGERPNPATVAMRLGALTGFLRTPTRRRSTW